MIHGLRSRGEETNNIKIIMVSLKDTVLKRFSWLINKHDISKPDFYSSEVSTFGIFISEK